MRRAVLDVGSNSVLLTVCELQSDRWVPIVERSAVTSLGEGVKQTGLLSEAAMSRTLAAIAAFFAEARSLGALSIRAAGTMAVRIARNSVEFLSRAESQGTPVSVLSGEEEARLGFACIATDAHFGSLDRFSIVDVGGQSTELTVAVRQTKDWEILFKRSYPIGTLALIGEVLAEETPGPEALFSAARRVDEVLNQTWEAGFSGAVVALGATGTNLVTLRDQMTVWDPVRVHGARLDYEEVSRAVGWLAGMPLIERALLPGMEPGREKTLHAGALILERFLFALRAESCLVSVRGWRHAMLEGEA